MACHPSPWRCCGVRLRFAGITLDFRHSIKSRKRGFSGGFPFHGVSLQRAIDSLQTIRRAGSCSSLHGEQLGNAEKA